MGTLTQRTHYVLSVDCVVFGYAEGTLQVALIERKNGPFKGYWALPGGFLEDEETIEQAAYRELQEETGIHDIYLEQFHVFSKPDRDPRGRVVTVALFALIPSDKVILVATNDALRAQWFEVYHLPTLAFDHEKIYAQALYSLRNAVMLKPLIFELLPKKFTLSMLQYVYEQIFNKVLDKRNFRKKVMAFPFIQETKQVTQGESHRPSRLYQFNKQRYKMYSSTLFSF